APAPRHLPEVRVRPQDIAPRTRALAPPQAPRGRAFAHPLPHMRHLACKPGSVGQLSLRDGHSSGSAVAGALVQPTRTTGPGTGLEPKPRVVPIWSCSRWGLPCDPCCQAPGALLPHPFTLTGRRAGGLLSVALSLGSPPAAV